MQRSGINAAFKFNRSCRPLMAALGAIFLAISYSSCRG
jgi:hypothetical protein